MDEIAQPVVITAIADADFEGLVSSALFARGWNIIARPLDLNTLEREVFAHQEANLLVIYSVDLPGLTRQSLDKISRSKISIFGFADAAGSPRGFSEISPRPHTAEELLTYIRGNIRSPLLRAPLIRSTPNFKARIIAVGGAGHSTGATTLALNLAQELALLNKNTLLIDANFVAPAISTLLDLRKLTHEDKWRDLSANLSVSEITQSSATDFATRAEFAAAYFDFLVIDLGSITNLASDLSDRRWSSQVKIWSSTFAQDLLVTTGFDLLQCQRLNLVNSELGKIKLSARITTCYQGMGEKGRDAQFKYLPIDTRASALARKERTTLAQVNEKAPLRKAIAELARQISGSSQA